MPRRRRQLRRKVKIPKEYLNVIDVCEKLFSPLYQFENGLRLAINGYLTSLYGEDWWEISLKSQLPKIYKYAEDVKKKKDNMPSIAKSRDVKPLPIHYITLGQLEEIVKKYRSDCVPELFPTLDFFTGHMHLIKAVRNLYTHMFPCITKADVTAAKREITTLANHINEKL